MKFSPGIPLLFQCCFGTLLILCPCLVRIQSVIMSNIMGNIPTYGAHSSFLNGGGPGSNGLLSTNDDFYNWIRNSVIAVVFQDATCGDGICSSLEEMPAVGDSAGKSFVWRLKTCYYLIA